MSRALLVALALVALGCRGLEPDDEPTSTTEKVCTVFADGSVLCSDGTGRPAP